MVALRSRWVLGVSLLACGAALLVALLVGPSSQADDPGASVSPSPAFAAPVTAGEVPALRTESSRTYRKADGSYQAQVSAGPVNYRDASGDWKPIDTDFVADGDGGLKTTEAAAKVSLPESLDDPAKVTAGSRWVSFEMAGADGDVVPTADGSTATYKDVLDGVDADYDAQPTGVKETLTLAVASAPASYRYALDASSGLRPRLLGNGTVVFRDAGGVTRFWLPAPTVQEAGADSPTTDHVAYRLSEDRQTLTVAVDPDWLADAAFPVQVELDSDGQYSPDTTKKKLSDMDLHNNRVGYDNASTVSLYRACLGMRRAATKSNAYNAIGRAIDGAAVRQLVYVFRDNHDPDATIFAAQSPSKCK
jgi:hypothetical protein